MGVLRICGHKILLGILLLLGFSMGKPKEFMGFDVLSLLIDLILLWNLIYCSAWSSTWPV
jgi:hypothetical protein